MQKEGFALAIEDSNSTPQNGSVCLSVLRYDNNVSTEVSFRCILDEEDALAIAARIRAIRQDNDSTGVVQALARARSILSSGGRPGARQIIALATDGLPNEGQDCDPGMVRPVPHCSTATTCSSLDDEVAALQAAGVDELNIITVEDPENELFEVDFRSFYSCRVFPAAEYGQS